MSLVRANLPFIHFNYLVFQALTVAYQQADAERKCLSGECSELRAANQVRLHCGKAGGELPYCVMQPLGRY